MSLEYPQAKLCDSRKLWNAAINYTLPVLRGNRVSEDSVRNNISVFGKIHRSLNVSLLKHISKKRTIENDVPQASTQIKWNLCTGRFSRKERCNGVDGSLIHGGRLENTPRYYLKCGRLRGQLITAGVADTGWAVGISMSFFVHSGRTINLSTEWSPRIAYWLHILGAFTCFSLFSTPPLQYQHTTKYIICKIIYRLKTDCRLTDLPIRYFQPDTTNCSFNIVRR